MAKAPESKPGVEPLKRRKLALIAGVSPARRLRSSVPPAVRAPLVLRHRIIRNFQAEADGQGPEEIIQALLGEVTEQG